MNITNKDYFTFNVDNSALIVGQTGTGKTELVRTYIRRIEKAFSPDKMKYAIFDLKAVEFDTSYKDGAKEEYLFRPIITDTSEGIEYLEELVVLTKQRIENGVREPFIFIYIEECDIAVQYLDRFHNVVKSINENAHDANVKLIFSTSRPSVDILPSDFISSFDLVLAGRLASKTDEETVGVLNTAILQPYEFYVHQGVI